MMSLAGARGGCRLQQVLGAFFTHLYTGPS
jgi:hypothetical protein